MNGSVFIATSLDGFIAREDGAIDWLEQWSGESDEDYGYQAFMETVDILVMGRKTYEQVLTFGEWPYGEKPVVVLSHQSLTIPEDLPGSVEVMSGSPEVVVRRLAERGAGHLYIDGGRTIQSFLAAGWIQRLIITTIPVLIGAGIRLFGPLSRDIGLHHVVTRQFPDGLVQNEYTVAKKSSK